MKKKIHIIFVKFIFIASSIIFTGCQKEFEWYAASTRPYNYVSEGQHIFYLKEGKIIIKNFAYKV